MANTSPANEGQYHEPTKAESWLAKSKTVNGNERVDCTKAGLSALRTSYEALAIFTILGGTVQRFDPQIRMGRLKDIKYEKSLIFDVVEKHGEISDLIEGHLPSDEFGIIPTPEILEEHINIFKEIKTKLKLSNSESQQLKKMKATIITNAKTIFRSQCKNRNCNAGCMIHFKRFEFEKMIRFYLKNIFLSIW